MKKIFIFFTMAFLITNCASCNKTNNRTSNNLKSEKRVLKKRIDDATNLSPQTVLVKATLLKNQNSEVMYFRIDKVLDYGHSTPTVAKGEKIYVKVNAQKFGNRILKDKTGKILLKYITAANKEQNPVEWKLISIKK